jgi:hypothetical protein
VRYRNGLGTFVLRAFNNTIPEIGRNRVRNPVSGGCQRAIDVMRVARRDATGSVAQKASYRKLTVTEFMRDGRITCAAVRVGSRQPAPLDCRLPKVASECSPVGRGRAQREIPIRRHREIAWPED